MESLAGDLVTMVRRPLTDAHVAALRRNGEERSIPEGTIFLRTGDPTDQFYYVREGEFQLMALAGDTSLKSVTIHSGEDGQDWTLNAKVGDHRLSDWSCEVNAALIAR